MNTLRKGNKVIGEMTPDGEVHAGTGFTSTIKGYVTQDGHVLVKDGPCIGSVDGAGNILNALGIPVGMVDHRGSVTLYGRRFGSVQGYDPLRAGAACLLFSEGHGSYEASSRSRYEPPTETSWIMWGVGLMLGLFVLMFLFAVLAVTAIMWGGMLLLVYLSTLILANQINKLLPSEYLATLIVVQQPTKRGVRTCLSEEALRPFSRLYPNLFLAIAPALGYGLIMGTMSIALSSRVASGENIGFLVGTYGGSAGIALLAARKLLYFQLNRLLLAQRDHTLASGMSVAPQVPITMPSWNRFATFAAAALAITFILCYWTVQKAQVKQRFFATLVQIRLYGQAVEGYLKSTGGRFDLSNADFRTKLAPYLQGIERGDITFSFNDNLTGVNLADLQEPASTIMFYEGTGQQFIPSYEGRGVLGYADGHVKAQKFPLPDSIRWQPVRASQLQPPSPSVQEERHTEARPSEPTASGEAKPAGTNEEEPDLPVHKDPPSAPEEEVGTKDESAPISPVSPTTETTLEQQIRSVSERTLSEEDLVRRSDRELTLMRNGPYARHGYRFQKEAIRSYFAHQPWYRPTTGDMDKVSKTLSDTERRNTKLILEYQHKRSPANSAGHSGQ